MTSGGGEVTTYETPNEAKDGRMTISLLLGTTAIVLTGLRLTLSTGRLFGEAFAACWSSRWTVVLL